MTELRYAFGRNWDEFISKKLSDKIIDESAAHISKFMRSRSLKGKTFLDIGCGSGIHSLAALRLGADRVFSFDYDHDSVATSLKVREWAGIVDRWDVRQGSVLDRTFMAGLPKVDIVYSWGVLHHTGAMWDAVRNAALPLKPDGEYYIALYSSDNYVDPSPQYWIKLKTAYNKAAPLARALMEMQYLNWQLVEPAIASGGDPLGAVRSYGKRGMTAWTDVKDWLGGFPIEFAGYRETRDFCARELGLDLVNVLTGEGCTEYMFARLTENAKWRETEAGRVRKELKGPFRPLKGAAYVAEFPPELADTGDSDSDHMRSPVMIYEDGEALGLAHASPALVCAHGGGRFRHEGRTAVFAATDGSDPNSNGRAYAYCANY